MAFWPQTSTFSFEREFSTLQSLNVLSYAIDVLCIANAFSRLSDDIQAQTMYQKSNFFITLCYAKCFKDLWSFGIIFQRL